MKNKKRVLIASSLSCAILLLSAATTLLSKLKPHKDSQDQNKKEHVDKSQQKDKRNVTNKDKNSTAPDDIGKKR